MRHWLEKGRRARGWTGHAIKCARRAGRPFLHSLALLGSLRKFVQIFHRGVLRGVPARESERGNSHANQLLDRWPARRIETTRSPIFVRNFGFHFKNVIFNNNPIALLIKTTLDCRWITILDHEPYGLPGIYNAEF